MVSEETLKLNKQKKPTGIVYKHRFVKTYKSTERRIKNAHLVSDSGQGSCQDRSAGKSVPLLSFNTYATWQTAVNLYNADPFAKKLVNIPVEDMLREHWEYRNLEDEQITAMLAFEKRLRLHKTLLQALKQERVLGGCAILMGVNDGLAMKEPIDMDRVPIGGLRFLNVVPRNFISKVQYDNDPTSPFFGRPRQYILSYSSSGAFPAGAQGNIVHASRLIVFDGDPLFYINNPTVQPQGFVNKDGMGVSIITTCLDNLYRVTGSQQAAAHLIDVASVFLVSADVQSLLERSDGSGASTLNPKMGELEAMIEQLSNYKAAILQSGPDGAATSVTSLPANFGAVPELLITMLQILAAAVDIPAVRFLSQSPGGLNATGTADLENYYNSIQARQNSNLEPALLPLFEIMQKSLFGTYKPSVIEFPPLWNLSELESAQVRQIDTQNIANMITSNIINEEQGYTEAVARGVIESKDIINDGFDESLTLRAEQEDLDQSLGELGRGSITEEGEEGEKKETPFAGN